jgi:6-phosphogluconolactonase
MVDLFGTTLLISEDPIALALRAAEVIAEIAHDAVAAQGRFTLALCGGSTPEKTYSLLGRPERPTAIEWGKTYVFFGDERFVPHGDSRSNYRMAQQALLRHVPIASSQVFPVPTEWSSAANAANGYARKLSSVFAAWQRDSEPASSHSEPGSPRPRENSREIPRFDLILLGLGEDGHTASLFPGAAALDVRDALVTWSLPGLLPPPVDRITFTFPLLNAARNVMFLVNGESKAAILHEILEGSAAAETYPARGIRPTDGRLMWLIDRAAATKLTPSHVAALNK